MMEREFILDLNIDQDHEPAAQIADGRHVEVTSQNCRTAAGIKEEIRLLLFGSDILDLECFSGQPAQLFGVSAAGLSLSLGIVGVKEEKRLQRSGVESCGWHQ